MIEVHLSREDMAWAERIGADRLRTAKGKPRWEYGDGRSGRDTHILGAAAELAFCRAIGVEWPARVGTYKAPDVDPQWEVRWSTGPRVKVAVNDGEERLVALVNGKPPDMKVIGYIRAGGAKRYPLSDPGNRGRPAHFIPARHLVPINPGFHTLHGYAFTAGRWACAFCGTPSVTGVSSAP